MWYKSVESFRQVHVHRQIHIFLNKSRPYYGESKMHRLASDREAVAQ